MADPIIYSITLQSMSPGGTTRINAGDEVTAAILRRLYAEYVSWKKNARPGVVASWGDEIPEIEDFLMFWDMMFLTGRVDMPPPRV